MYEGEGEGWGLLLPFVMLMYLFVLRGLTWEGSHTNNFFQMLYDSYLKVEMKVKSDKYLTPGEMMI